MNEQHDGELKRALDALDARQVPAAAADWGDLIVAALEADATATATSAAAPDAAPGAAPATSGPAEHTPGAVPLPFGARERRRQRVRRRRLILAACITLAVLFILVCSGAGARLGIPSPLNVFRHSSGDGHEQPAHPRRSASPSPSHSSGAGVPAPGQTRVATTPSATPTVPKTLAPTPVHTRPPAPDPSSWADDGPAAPVLQAVASGTKATLTAVDFTDTQAGWVVGTGGTVLTTQNAGTTWNARTAKGLNLPDSMPTDVDFVGGGVGWALVSNDGDDPTILATDDGGATWTAQPETGSAALYDLAAVDAQHAWAVGVTPGEGGCVVATSDGTTWAKQSVPACGALTHVAFADAAHGWATSSTGAILATGDGGATWTLQLPGDGEQLTAVHFIDGQRGWAAGYTQEENGSRALLLSTSDGGVTWKKKYTGGLGTMFDQLTFADSLHGWATARSASTSLCVMTVDGGSTWTVALHLSPSVAIKGIAALAADRACLVGTQGTIYVSGEGE